MNNKQIDNLINRRRVYSNLIIHKIIISNAIINTKQNDKLKFEGGIIATRNTYERSQGI